MELLKPTEVCERLRVSESTLRRWRQDGIGPPWFRIGGELGSVRYDRDGFEGWFQAQRQGEEQPATTEG